MLNCFLIIGLLSGCLDSRKQQTAFVKLSLFNFSEKKPSQQVLKDNIYKIKNPQHRLIHLTRAVISFCDMLTVNVRYMQSQCVTPTINLTCLKKKWNCSPFCDKRHCTNQSWLCWQLLSACLLHTGFPVCARCLLS